MVSRSEGAKYARCRIAAYNSNRCSRARAFTCNVRAWFPQDMRNFYLIAGVTTKVSDCGRLRKRSAGNKRLAMRTLHIGGMI